MCKHNLYLLGLFVAWVVYAGPLVWTDGQLFHSDTGFLDVPNRLHAARMWREGTFPLWTPSVLCGFPLFAEGQTGILYPGFLVYMLWPTPDAHDIFMALHYGVAGLTMYGLLVARVSRPAAYCGAVTFMASAFLRTTHVVPGTLATLCWLPLSLLLIDRIGRGQPRLIWLVALINGMALLAGHVHIALISYALQALFLLVMCPWQGITRSVIRCGIVTVLPVVIAGVQIIPTFGYFLTSNRASGISWEDTVQSALPWSSLLTFFMPHYLGDPWHYTAGDLAIWEETLVVFHGFAAVVLVPLAIVMGRRSGWLRFWSVVLVLGVLLATASPIMTWVYRLPVFNWFRWPSRYMLLASVAISIITAHGVAELLTRIGPWLESGRLWRRPLVSLAICLLVTWGIAFRTMRPFLSTGGFYSAASSDIVEAARSGSHFRLLAPPGSIHDFASEQRLEENAQCLVPNYNLLDDVPVANLFDMYNTVSPRDIVELLSLPHLNVIRVAAITHLTSEAPIYQDDRWELISSNPYVYRFRQSFPRAWMVYRFRELPARSVRLRAISLDTFDPHQEVILEESVRLGTPPDTPTTVLCRETSPGTLAIEIVTESSGLLVVADSFSPHVSATLDDFPVKVLRANHAFRAVKVPVGKHRVVMKYSPRMFYAGCAVSLAGFFTLGVGVWNPRKEAGS